MATVKTTIKKREKRSDGTWNILIRITHNRKSYYLRTSLFVSKKDLTSSFKIKNQQIIDRCREIEIDIRAKIAKLNLDISDMDISQIVQYLKKNKENKNVDFIAFSRQWLEKQNNLKGIRNYKTALNSFIHFFGRERIFVEEITSKTLQQFEDYLSGKKRAQSLYLSAILRLFNEAKKYYNDEDLGIRVIKHSINFKVKKQNVAEKRSLPIETIRSIFALPYVGEMNSRRNLAKDCFMMSFCLMGINSVDLYNAKEFDGDKIIYYRTKTMDRREYDHAKMVVSVHPFILPIVRKYLSASTDEYVFNFHHRFANTINFNNALNIGLKDIAKEIGLDNLQFYSARHSFATIAVNKVGINKYIVNDMLCHVDQSMKITELYIEKDYSIINDANYQLLDYMFAEEIK